MFIEQFAHHYGVAPSRPFMEAVNNTTNVKAALRAALKMSDEEEVLCTLEQKMPTSYRWSDIVSSINNMLAYSGMSVTADNVWRNRMPDGSKLSRVLLKAEASLREHFYHAVDNVVHAISDMMGFRYLSLDRALQKLYDYIGTQHDVTVYLTTKADDFFGLSENCSWSSCVCAGGAYDGSCSAWMRQPEAAIVYGTIDTDSRRKLFRALLFVEEGGNFAIGRVYGHAPADAIETVAHALCQRIYPLREWEYWDSGTLDYNSTESESESPYIDQLHVRVIGKEAEYKDIYLTELRGPLCLDCGEVHDGQRVLCEDCRPETVECVSCGEEVFYSDASTVHDGVTGRLYTFCSSCVSEEATQCSHCDAHFFTHTLVSVGDDLYCTYCLERVGVPGVQRCNECGEWYETDEGCCEPETEEEE